MEYILSSLIREHRRLEKDEGNKTIKLERGAAGDG